MENLIQPANCVHYLSSKLQTPAVRALMQVNIDADTLL
jgi:hypothetical protein